jgi:hypothetical protein
LIQLVKLYYEYEAFVLYSTADYFLLSVLPPATSEHHKTQEVTKMILAYSSACTMMTGSRSAVSIARKNSTLHQDDIPTCLRFVGRPLSRDEATAKMERCPQFLEAAHDFTPSPRTAKHDKEHDIVEIAVLLDYGMRLRSCLLAASVRH